MDAQSGFPPERVLGVLEIPEVVGEVDDSGRVRFRKLDASPLLERHAPSYPLLPWYLRALRIADVRMLRQEEARQQRVDPHQAVARERDPFGRGLGEIAVAAERCPLIVEHGEEVHR